MLELKKLWTLMLGTPPGNDQFTVWQGLHTEEVIRLAIMKTAAKDLSVGKTMDMDYKIRFASKVMLVQTERNVNNLSNRQRIAEEFGTRHVDAIARAR